MIDLKINSSCSSSPDYDLIKKCNDGEVTVSERSETRVDSFLNKGESSSRIKIYLRIM